jgi:hypothetical protein
MTRIRFGIILISCLILGCATVSYIPIEEITYPPTNEVKFIAFDLPNTITYSFKIYPIYIYQLKNYDFIILGEIYTTIDDYNRIERIKSIENKIKSVGGDAVLIKWSKAPEGKLYANFTRSNTSFNFNSGMPRRMKKTIRKFDITGEIYGKVVKFKSKDLIPDSLFIY